MSFKNTHKLSLKNNSIHRYTRERVQRRVAQGKSTQLCCDRAAELMVFLLLCPTLPLNIYHWTLHGKLRPLDFTQSLSRCTSGATIKQTTQYSLHSDPMSLHIKTYSLPHHTPFKSFLSYLHSLSFSLSSPPAPVDLLPASSQSSPPLVCWLTPCSFRISSCVSLGSVMKRFLEATVAERVEGAGKGKERREEEENKWKKGRWDGGYGRVGG